MNVFGWVSVTVIAAYLLAAILDGWYGNGDRVFRLVVVAVAAVSVSVAAAAAACGDALTPGGRMALASAAGSVCGGARWLRRHGWLRKGRWL